MHASCEAAAAISALIRSPLRYPSQASPSTTKLAIQSLAAYSSLAAEFVIVAPPVTHSSTVRVQRSASLCCCAAEGPSIESLRAQGRLCDFGTYRRRAWCRAEQLCHLFRNGMDNMWLATSTEHVQKLHHSSPPKTRLERAEQFR